MQGPSIHAPPDALSREHHALASADRPSGFSIVTLPEKLPG